MPDPASLGVFALASLALLVVPGPSVLYIVTRSISQGRMAGLASVLGVHVGTTFHIAAAALGSLHAPHALNRRLQCRQVTGSGLSHLFGNSQTPR